MDCPLANDHLHGQSSCKRSSGWTCVLQRIIWMDHLLQMILPPFPCLFFFTSAKNIPNISPLSFPGFLLLSKKIYFPSPKSKYFPPFPSPQKKHISLLLYRFLLLRKKKHIFLLQIFSSFFLPHISSPPQKIHLSFSNLIFLFVPHFIFLQQNNRSPNIIFLFHLCSSSPLKTRRNTKSL